MDGRDPHQQRAPPPPRPQVCPLSLRTSPDLAELPLLLPRPVWTAGHDLNPPTRHFLQSPPPGRQLPLHWLPPVQSGGQGAHPGNDSLVSLQSCLNRIIQSLVELLGFGRNISIDTSLDEEEVHQDDNTSDVYDGDDSLERYENVTSPSHSGGITSPEADPLQDFEADSDDSSEVGGQNELELEDPYQFIASPVSKKKKSKTSDTTQPSGSGRDKKCKNCKLRVSAITFKKHIVTHMYDKWPEVGIDSKYCSVCHKTLQGQKYLINHLATVHHQLEEKLAEEGETVESYEMEIEEEAGVESVDTVSNNLVQEMELEPSVLFTAEENDNDPVDPESRGDDDNDSDATVPCSPRDCDDSIGD